MQKITKIKKIFFNDPQVCYQLNVLNAVGVDISMRVEVVRGRFVIEPELVEILQSYLDIKNIINRPSIKLSAYTVQSIDALEICKPQKELLRQSAIRGGFSPRNSNFETIVERIYQESLKDVKRQEEQLRETLLTVLNQNLKFLQKAVANFIELYEGRL
jgi:uncharacterized 2Fe-2S/4Fe-4S cluster protein (DUF4445 family)